MKFKMDWSYLEKPKYHPEWLAEYCLLGIFVGLFFPNTMITGYSALAWLFVTVGYALYKVIFIKRTRYGRY